MPDPTRRRCRICGGHESEVGPISWSGKCALHGLEALTDNIVQMHARRGPNFDRWRRSMAACVGGVLIDDASERP